MKSLVEFIRECMAGAVTPAISVGGQPATPANTVGIGNVEPLASDPVPAKTNILKKKFRRRKVKKRRSSA